MDNTENNSYEIQEMNESAEHSHSGSRVHADSFLGEEGGISDAEKPKVMNATLGAGILSLPYAANQCGGLLIFLLMQYSFAFLAAMGLLLLAKCADVGNASVYQEVVETMTGSDIWVTFVRIIIVIYALSSCVALMIVIGDQGQDIFKFVIGEETFNEHKEVYRKLILLTLCSCVVLPLMMPRSISFLELPSLASFISVLYVVLAVACLYDADKLDGVNVKTHPDDGKAVFNSLPTIAFGYQCHVSGVPVYCSLKNRNLKNWLMILSASTLLSSLMYSCTTVFGYLTFGDQVADDILLSYSADNIPILIARLGVMISVMMGYPTIHYCGRVCLEDVYRKIMNISNTEGNQTWTKRYYIQTVSWFVVTLLAALFLPGISKVLNIAGAFSAFFILGFPGLCILRYGIMLSDYTRNPALFANDMSIVANLLDPMDPPKPRTATLFMIIGSIYIVLCAFLFGEAFSLGIIELT
ncbi:sodium-coupled neutral amino acid transporter 7-like isoform X2 [Convolutriloba macropyga]|uniref:sodium-coupled neutral amino acid transporter 7-like isoform X2 n=1 Tax=Convolutriloba macropyga TaxID=536237 RepID=UPI003F51DE7D